MAIDPEPPEIPPHEQDDPDLASYPPHTNAQQPYAGSGFTATPNPLSGILSSVASAPIKTIIQGADPAVEYEDGDIILTMEGGRETYFASTSGTPVNINGQQRRFRLTREGAQELTRKLARMLAEHSDD